MWDRPVATQSHKTIACYPKGVQMALGSSCPVDIWLSHGHPDTFGTAPNGNGTAPDGHRMANLLSQSHPDGFGLSQSQRHPAGFGMSQSHPGAVSIKKSLSPIDQKWLYVINLNFFVWRHECHRFLLKFWLKQVFSCLTPN